MKMDDLKELLGKVTPGPWAYRPTQYDDWGTVRAGEWFLCQAKDPRHLEDDHLNSCRKNGCDPWEANARLIAMAPDLAAEVLRLRAEVERLTEALRSIEGRVEEASDSLHNSTEWAEREFASSGQSYWDWIFEPARAALRAARKEGE